MTNKRPRIYWRVKVLSRQPQNWPLTTAWKKLQSYAHPTKQCYAVVAPGETPEEAVLRSVAKRFTPHLLRYIDFSVPSQESAGSSSAPFIVEATLNRKGQA